MAEKDKGDREQTEIEARSFVRSLWKTAARQWREDEQGERRQAIHFALRQVCKHNQEEMSMGLRSFYMTKAICCCWMDWRNEKLLLANSENCVEGVALWSRRAYREFGNNRRFWKELKVGRGILTGWHFEVTEDID